MWARRTLGLPLGLGLALPLAVLLLSHQLCGTIAGKVLDPALRFSLAKDGLTFMPDALSPMDLKDMNDIVDRAISHLENNTQSLSSMALTKLARATESTGRKSYGATDNSLFCFGDITQRDPGKYELRTFYDSQREVNTLPESIIEAPRWLRTIYETLGRDAELRSATVILSTAEALVTNETATTQHWHSDGALASGPNGKLSLDTYGLVVYIPLRSVLENGGRVEYLPKTHTDLDLRVEKLAGEWSEEWGADMVVPHMDAGTAAIYSFTTMHRGLGSSLPGFYRPVLKLDYFAANVARNDNKDGWCEHNGFVLGSQTFEPPVVDWFDWLDYWWPMMLTVGLVLGAGVVSITSSKSKKGKGKLKPKRR